MDKEKKNAAFEAFAEQGKKANRWFEDSMKNVTNMYMQPFNAASGFYNNPFQASLSGQGGFGNYMQFAKIFADMNPWRGMFDVAGLSKTASVNPMMAAYQHLTENITKMNQNLFNSLKDAGVPSADWDGIQERYKQMLESELQMFKRMNQMISEEYKKRMDEAIRANIDMGEEVNKLLNEAAKSNREFWLFLFKQYNIPTEHLTSSESKEKKKT